MQSRVFIPALAAAKSALRTGAQRGFSHVKARDVRPVDQFYQHMTSEVLASLRGSRVPVAPVVSCVSSEQKDHLISSYGLTLGALNPTLKKAKEAAFPLPRLDQLQFGASKIGIIDEAIRATGADPADISPEELKEKVNYFAYYRSMVLVEELARLGYSYEQVCEIVGKATFIGKHSGNPEHDPLLFSRTISMLYPQNSHVKPHSNDLGTTANTESWKQLVRGKHGMKAPLTIISGGDSTPTTHGFNDGMNAVRLALKEGKRAPNVFMVDENTRSITTEFAKGEIAKHFKSYGDLMSCVREVPAHDVAACLEARNEVFSKVYQTGIPGAVIFNGSMRIGGHATDGFSGNDDELMKMFKYGVDAIVGQLLSVCGPDLTPQDVADTLEERIGIADEVIGKQTEANHYMSFEQARKLTVAYSEVGDKEGNIVKMAPEYWIKANPGIGAKSGAQIIGEANNDVMNDSKDRKVSVVHQEGDPSVYRQLVPLSEENKRKLVSLPVNENAQAHYAAAAAELGLVSVCIWPHEYFTGVHTLSPMIASAHRGIEIGAYDRVAGAGGFGAAYWGIMDGGSLTDPTGKTPEAAKLGWQHNNHENAPWTSSPNVTVTTPMDANHYAAMASDNVRYVVNGRMVITQVPTKCYGVYHKNSALPKMGPYDVIQVDMPGEEPADGKELVVVVTGYITDDIIKSLDKTGVATTVYVMSSLEPTPALENALKEKIANGAKLNCVVVDTSPRASSLGPAMNEMLHNMGSPENLRVLYSTTRQTSIPYGVGEAAYVVPRDFNQNVLERYGMVNPNIVQNKTASEELVNNTVSSKIIPWHYPIADEIGETEEVEVTIRLHEGVEVGSLLDPDIPFAYIENDKDTQELYPVHAGVLEWINPRVLDQDPITTSKANKAEIIKMAVTNNISTAKAKKQVSKDDRVIVTALDSERKGMRDNMAVPGAKGWYQNFGVEGVLNMQEVKQNAKNNGFSVTTQIVYNVAQGLAQSGLNVKLTGQNHDQRTEFMDVNIGLAAKTPTGGLRVLVVRGVASKDANGQVTMKDPQALKKQVEELLERNQNGTLQPQDTDLEQVACVVTSLGKNAPLRVNPTRLPAYPMILGIGANVDGNAVATMNCCHGTLTGDEGATALKAMGVGAHHNQNTMPANHQDFGKLRTHVSGNVVSIRFPDRSKQDSGPAGFQR